MLERVFCYRLIGANSGKLPIRAVFGWICTRVISSLAISPDLVSACSKHLQCDWTRASGRRPKNDDNGYMFLWLRQL